MHTLGRSHAIVVLMLAFAAASLGPSSRAAAQNVNVRIDDHDGPLERCDQLDIEFDHRPALRDEERVQVPAGGEALRIDLSQHGGVALREGAGSEHEILLCKAVPDDAASGLQTIRPAIDGSSVSVTGPADGRWVGYLIVRSPRGSGVDLSATNGPIRVDDFEGRLTARTVNGPIALASVGGQVSARAENGPIKLQGGGGRVSLQTENGPIAVRLAGDEWQAGELVARAQNGPLSLEVPGAYRSSVEVESSGHAPWSCRGVPGCADREGTSDTRRAHFGAGPTRVRLSTVNGPVKVIQTRE